MFVLRYILYTYTCLDIHMHPQARRLLSVCFFVLADDNFCTVLPLMLLMQQQQQLLLLCLDVYVCACVDVINIRTHTHIHVISTHIHCLSCFVLYIHRGFKGISDEYRAALLNCTGIDWPLCPHTGEQMSMIPRSHFDDEWMEAMVKCGRYVI